MKVLVLGAGVIGVASAWYLARAGHEVTLVDRQPGPGLETSRANGGQVSAESTEPWASPEVLAKLPGWLGRADAPLVFSPRADLAQWAWGLRFLRECLPGRFERNTRRLVSLALHSRERLQALRAETGIEYDAVARGILQFCVDEAEFDSLAALARSMNRHGLRREVKSAAECLAIEPALARAETPIVGGVFTPADESGDACKFTQQLARLAAAQGVTFLGDTPVEGLEAGGGRIAGVRLAGQPGRRLEADAYVVALGSDSPLLLRPVGIRIPVYPLKGYSITIPLSASAAGLAPTVSLGDEAGKVVISRLGDRLRAAGTAELGGYDRTINPARCAAILAGVKRLFPGVADGVAVANWAGLRPSTPDNAPLIGRTRYPNLYLNTGHGSLGWTLACGSGSAIAEIVSGRAPEADFAFIGGRAGPG